MLMTAKALGLAALLVLGGNTQEQDKWAARVSARLTHANSFDHRTIPAHLNGVTGVSFRIGEDGRATDMRIVFSSNTDWLDRRAVSKVRLMGRLPEAPESVRGRTILALIEHGRLVNVGGRVTMEKARTEAIGAMKAEAQRLANLGVAATIIGA